MKKSNIFLLVTLSTLFIGSSNLKANTFAAIGIGISMLSIASNMPRQEYIPYYQFVPMSDQKNTYFIVKIKTDNSKSSPRLFRYSFSFADSLFTDPLNRLSFSVVSTPSLSVSEDPNLRDPFNRQIYIQDGCKNYFPIASGENFFWFHLNERKVPNEIEFFADFSLTRYIHVEANQSVYIEVDVENDDYSRVIIDTPKNIFSDMCK
ncbi:MAG: hypothetical protein O9301_02570 [Leptospira sp.]|nr:hypothetical protein [Leptospira sp.]